MFNCELIWCFLQAYVSCALGTRYIGYAMIVMGVANVASAILVAVFAKRIPREVVFGVGGIIHMGLMIGFLVWMPQKNLLIFYMLSASWGVCDAVWQTQCNSKYLVEWVEFAWRQDTRYIFTDYISNTTDSVMVTYTQSITQKRKIHKYTRSY